MEKQPELKKTDPELWQLIQDEKERQSKGIELIASENFTSTSVNECLGSCLTNKYAEGYPGQRYYGGTTVIDKIECQARERALTAYHLDPEQWGVNMQPYSGSPANFAVYTALLQPHDRIMGLDLPSGGHLTHGYYSYTAKTGQKKKISATSVYFESLPYKVSADTGLVDFDELAKSVDLFKPQMIICGGSAYPREWDYAKFREIADSCGALLMCDMAHISGLVVTQEAASPFEFCDIVTTTTHKSLRGPRSGMIFYKKDSRNFEERINFAVFPMLQGGPHVHQIAGVSTQLLQATKPEFKEYIVQVKKNATALADALTSKGYKMCTGGTDNHLILWDLRPAGINGNKMEKLCDHVMITLNKNAVLGDRSALAPGGVRIGTPAMTSRGWKETEFVKLADLLDRAVKIIQGIQEKVGKKLVDFVPVMKDPENEDINALRKEVNTMAESAFMPGI